jgi:hypothetical protein
MTFFGNPTHKKKKLECAWKHFRTQSSYWIKVKLDTMVRWRELDKSMCIKYIMYIFSIAIELHVHDTLPNQRKMKKQYNTHL